LKQPVVQEIVIKVIMSEASFSSRFIRGCTDENSSSAQQLFDQILHFRLFQMNGGSLF